MNAISQKTLFAGLKNLREEPGVLKANEEGSFIFRLKNIGTEFWPEDTLLYVTDYDKAPFNVAGTTTKILKCGPCRPYIFKQTEELKFLAPAQPGLYEYTLRVGSETKGAFGEPFNFRVNVEEDDFMEQVR